MDAATRVFVRQGFDAARMEDIAREAGLSKGALYLYFKSKDMMLERIIERFAKEKAAAAFVHTQSLTMTDPQAVLKQILRVVIPIASDPASSLVPRLVMSEANRFPRVAQTFRASVIDQMLSAVKMTVTEGVRQGIFRHVQTESAARFIMGPVIAHLLLTHVFNKPNEAALAPDTLAGDVIDMVIDGLRVPS